MGSLLQPTSNADSSHPRSHPGTPNILTWSDVTTVLGGSYTTFRAGMSKAERETRWRPFAAPNESENPRVANMSEEGGPSGVARDCGSRLCRGGGMGASGRSNDRMLDGQRPKTSLASKGPALYCGNRAYLHRPLPGGMIAPTRTALHSYECCSANGDTGSPRPVSGSRTARSSRANMIPADRASVALHARGKHRRVGCWRPRFGSESTPAKVPAASFSCPGWRATA